MRHKTRPNHANTAMAAAALAAAANPHAPREFLRKLRVTQKLSRHEICVNDF